LNLSDQLFRAEQYKNVIVAYNKGAAVRLGDVADVRDSVEDIRNAGLVAGAPAAPASGGRR
jgi:multidrug efflux pump